MTKLHFTVARAPPSILNQIDRLRWFSVANGGQTGSDFGLQPESGGHTDRYTPPWCFNTVDERDRMALFVLNPNRRLGGRPQLTSSYFTRMGQYDKLETGYSAYWD